MRRPGVVLLYSSLSSRHQWKRLAGELERGYDVLAPDLLGYADAPAADAQRYVLEDEVALVLRLADERFGAGASFHLAGHSYGGLAALALARANPGRIASLAVYEPVCFNLVAADDPDLAQFRAMAQDVTSLVGAARLPEATQRFFDYWNGSGAFRALPAAAQARLVPAIAKLPLEFRGAFAQPRLARAYAGIEAPTLLMGGAKSPRLTRGILRTLSNTLPNAALAWLDGGHMAPVTQPEEFNATFAAFLRWNAPAAQAA